MQALIESNDIKAKKLMDLFCEFPPRHFFCVLADKVARPDGREWNKRKKRTKRAEKDLIVKRRDAVDEQISAIS